MIEIVGMIAAALAIGGVVLNNYQSRWCFAVWVVSNLLSLYLHARAHRKTAGGMRWLIVRDIVFTGLAVHGFWLWSGKI